MAFFQNMMDTLKEKFSSFVQGDEEPANSYFAAPKDQEQYAQQPAQPQTVQQPQQVFNQPRQEFQRVFQFRPRQDTTPRQTAPQQPQAQESQPVPQQQNTWQAGGAQQGVRYDHALRVARLTGHLECCNMIPFMKNGESVLVDIEMIASDLERQRCVDLLSGAAYTLGYHMLKASAQGVYLIYPDSLYVGADEATKLDNGIKDEEEKPAQPVQEEQAQEEVRPAVGGYAPNPMRKFFRQG